MNWLAMCWLSLAVVSADTQPTKVTLVVSPELAPGIRSLASEQVRCELFAPQQGSDYHSLNAQARELLHARGVVVSSRERTAELEMWLERFRQSGVVVIVVEVPRTDDRVGLSPELVCSLTDTLKLLLPEHTPRILTQARDWRRAGDATESSTASGVVGVGPY